MRFYPQIIVGGERRPEGDVYALQKWMAYREVV